MTSYRQPGTVLTDHTFRVPLDYDHPDGAHIGVFAREVVAAGKADAGLPWLLFLQGGPGFGSPRPIGRDGWLRRAPDEYRVLLLDQRGTGRSTPANRLSLARLGSPASQLTFTSGPLYAVLHEACYAQGFATKWSAQRVRSEFRRISRIRSAHLTPARLPSRQIRKVLLKDLRFIDHRSEMSVPRGMIRLCVPLV